MSVQTASPFRLNRKLLAEDTQGEGLRTSSNTIAVCDPNDSGAIFIRSFIEDTTVEPRASTQEEAMKQVANSLKRMLLGIAGVEGVVVQNSDNGLDISVVANQLDRQRRWKVYDYELKLLEKYWDLNLEFHLIDREDAPIEEIIDLEATDVYLPM